MACNSRLGMRPAPSVRTLMRLVVVSLFSVTAFFSLKIARVPGIARAHGQGEDSLNVILYSGPTGLPSDKQLYHDNFIYFLNHGLPCSYHSGAVITRTKVIISLTEKNNGFYHDLISLKNTTCGDIYTFVRQDRCYDMETVRLFLEHRHEFSLGYNYSLFYVKCGMLGPLPKVAKPLGLQPHWTEYFGERSEKSTDSTRQVFPRVAGPFRVFPQRWGPGTRRRSEENYHLGFLKTLFPSGFGRRRSKTSLNPKRNVPDAQPRHVYERAWNRPKRLVQLR